MIETRADRGAVFRLIFFIARILLHFLLMLRTGKLLYYCWMLNKQQWVVC